jgi:2-polyprenyl-6-methoxyphenol hydroxylase-like FAD-dependent oxidoreductase
MVLERHMGLSLQPKARGQSPVTMEVMGIAGLEEAIRDATPEGSEGQFVVFAETMAGPPTASLPVGEVNLSAFSPATIGGCSQERTERILANRAAELGADVRFQHELVSVYQNQDGVIAQIRGLETGEQYEVHAQYLIAADGHRAQIRTELGIGTHGRRTRRPSATLFVQFDADLDEYTHGTAFGFYVLKNEALPRGQVTLTTTDYPHRYVMGVTFDHKIDLTDAVEQERVEAVIRTACGVPDLEFTVLDTSWTAPGQYVTRVADVFTLGRVFLVGDSAHLMPPAGGMGGNTAILDGYHLAWKLAAVLNGTAGPGLLDSHDTERRPVGDMMAEQQFANLARRHAPELLDDTVARGLDPARMLFGLVLQAGAFVPDEVADAEEKLTHADGGPNLFERPKTPTGRPGARAPHVAFTRDGAPVSTRQLFQTRFVVLTQSADWAAAAAEAGQRLGLPLDIHVIGAAGDFADSGGRFPVAYRIGEDGAVLVRPDGLVGWRSRGPGRADGLEGALRFILDREEPGRPYARRQPAEAAA